MKRSLVFAALTVIIGYVLKEVLGGEKRTAPEPPKKHLTNVFAKAKEHATNLDVS